MPTSTFFNLPPPKRERLLRAAISEFVQKPFGEVSINRIIRVAEIPRGSFYQYFTDKTDLFRHILNHFGGRMETAVLTSLDACGGDLLAVPLKLFDLVLTCIQENKLEFHVMTCIIRQNIGMDVGQLWRFPDNALAVLERADTSRLRLTGQAEQLALLDLLLSSTLQALMAVSSGKLSREDSRTRLKQKITIIRQGAEIREELC